MAAAAFVRKRACAIDMSTAVSMSHTPIHMYVHVSTRPQPFRTPGQRFQRSRVLPGIMSGVVTYSQGQVVLASAGQLKMLFCGLRTCNRVMGQKGSRGCSQCISILGSRFDTDSCLRTDSLYCTRGIIYLFIYLFIYIFILLLLL